jgi:hypothetical protein
MLVKIILKSKKLEKMEPLKTFVKEEEVQTLTNSLSVDELLVHKDAEISIT